MKSSAEETCGSSDEGEQRGMPPPLSHLRHNVDTQHRSNSRLAAARVIGQASRNDDTAEACRPSVRWATTNTHWVHFGNSSGATSHMTRPFQSCIFAEWTSEGRTICKARLGHSGLFTSYGNGHFVHIPKCFLASVAMYTCTQVSRQMYTLLGVHECWRSVESTLCLSSLSSIVLSLNASPRYSFVSRILVTTTSALSPLPL